MKTFPYSTLNRSALAAFTTVLALLGLVSAGMADETHREMANRDRSFDHLGQLHNDTLDHAIEIRQVLGDDPAPLTAAVMGRTLRFIREALHGPCAVAVVDFDRIARVVSQPKASMEELADVMPKEQLAFALRLEALARHLADDPSVSREIRHLEAEIAAKLSRQDAAPLLMSSSIARFSARYWRRQVDLGDKSPWLGRGGQTGGVLPTDDWIVADWLGALKGALYAREHGLPEEEAAAVGASLASSVVLIDHVYD